MKKYPYKKLIIITSLFLLLIIASYIYTISYKKLLIENMDNNGGEKDNKYVSSRGILLSCDIHSPNPQSSTRSIYDIDLTKVKDGSVVYIPSSAIAAFVPKLKSLPGKVVLVSGDSDDSIPDAVLSSNDFITFIESDKIIHWFSQNCVGVHPKLTPIPIGLDYHSIKSGNIAIGNQMSAKDQENEIITIKNAAKPLSEREPKIYSNFHFNKQKDRKYTYDRDDAIEKIPKDLIFYEPSPVSRKETHMNQSKYAFVGSPHGNGLDCHRTWEALCLGCIPIVKTSPIDSVFDDLPVLIVQDWSDVTKELLDFTIKSYSNQNFNYNKLTLQYWMDLIRSKKVLSNM